MRPPPRNERTAFAIILAEWAARLWRAATFDRPIFSVVPLKEFQAVAEGVFDIEPFRAGKRLVLVHRDAVR